MKIRRSTRFTWVCSSAVVLGLCGALAAPPAACWADHHNDASKSEGDASEQASKDGDDDEKQEKDQDDDEPKLSVTEHAIEIEGELIEFSATAGKMVQKADDGKPKAEIFFVAYVKSDANTKERPITYCFNGGPGSSSVWLHLGALGPKLVKIPDDATQPAPPHELIDNPYSLLDVTDLVMIDPVSTGFSRPTEGQDKRQFHGYDEDVNSVGQFIHDYTTKYGRWPSPKFLLGESYGGIRAAGLSGRLQQRYRMYLNGIVLISAVVDFQTLSTGSSNELPYPLFLPSYAATAWYHDALPESTQSLSLEELSAQAEEFAGGDYRDALFHGNSYSEESREAVIERMSALTGLTTDYIEDANLRVSMPRFGKELLRDRGLVVGRFDSRYVGFDPDNVGESTGHDPSGTGLMGAFASAMNQYLRDELEVEEDRVYEILTGSVHPWDYSEFTNRFVDASDTLREAMANNPHLKVFAACGYYDLATPWFAMQYSRDHLSLPESLRENFTTAYYEAGHMMYVHEPSLAKLRKDLMAFYASAMQEPAE